MLYPMTNNKLNIKAAVLTPNLSIMNPPVNGKIQFGSE